MQTNNPWVPIHVAWAETVEQHPELCLASGPYAVYNFLRSARETLLLRGVIKKVRGRRWIADRSTFADAVFDFVTTARAA